MPDNLDETKMLIRSVLTTHKDSIDADTLNSEFRSMIGSSIDFRKFGYTSLLAFLQTITDILHISYRGSKPFFDVIPDEQTVHITNLVSRQKSSSKRPRGRPLRYVLPPRQRTFVSSNYTVNNYSLRQSNSASVARQQYIARRANVAPRFAYKHYFGSILGNAPAEVQETFQPSQPSLGNNTLKNVETAEPPKQEEPQRPESRSSIESSESSTSRGHLNYEKIKSQFRELLQSHPQGVQLKYLKAKFKEHTGFPLKAKDLGYNNFTELVESSPELFEIKIVESRWMVYEVSEKQNSVNQDASVQNESSPSIPRHTPADIADNVIRLLRQRKTKGIPLKRFILLYKNLFSQMLSLKELGYKDENEFFESLMVNHSNMKMETDVNGEKTAFLISEASENLIKQQKEHQTSIPAPSDAVTGNRIFSQMDINVCTEDITGFISVKISEVITPWNFWFQIVYPCIVQLEGTMDELDVGYNGTRGDNYKIPQSQLRVNLLCAAKYPGDNNWHRCVITKIPDEQTVEVFYVDYGTVGDVQVNNIRYLMKKFLSEPAFALPAMLHGIQPNGCNWSKQSRRALLDLTAERVIQAHIVEKTPEGIYSLFLCDTNEKEEVHINELLISQGYALEVITDYGVFYSDDENASETENNDHTQTVEICADDTNQFPEKEDVTNRLIEVTEKETDQALPEIDPAVLKCSMRPRYPEPLMDSELTDLERQQLEGFVALSLDPFVIKVILAMRRQEAAKEQNEILSVSDGISSVKSDGPLKLPEMDQPTDNTVSDVKEVHETKSDELTINLTPPDTLIESSDVKVLAPRVKMPPGFEHSSRPGSRNKKPDTSSVKKFSYDLRGPFFHLPKIIQNNFCKKVAISENRKVNLVSYNGIAHLTSQDLSNIIFESDSLLEAMINCRRLSVEKLEVGISECPDLLYELKKKRASGFDEMDLETVILYSIDSCLQLSNALLVDKVRAQKFIQDLEECARKFDAKDPYWVELPQWQKEYQAKRIELENAEIDLKSSRLELVQKLYSRESNEDTALNEQLKNLEQTILKIHERKKKALEEYNSNRDQAFEAIESNKEPQSSSATVNVDNLLAEVEEVLRINVEGSRTEAKVKKTVKSTVESVTVDTVATSSAIAKSSSSYACETIDGVINTTEVKSVSCYSGPTNDTSPYSLGSPMKYNTVPLMTYQQPPIRPYQVTVSYPNPVPGQPNVNATPFIPQNSLFGYNVHGPGYLVAPPPPQISQIFNSVNISYSNVPNTYRGPVNPDGSFVPQGLWQPPLRTTWSNHD